MDRPRRPESFDDVCADGLFRATTAKWILARRGDIFMQDVPVCIFESSSLVEHVDVFVSHSWRSAHWAKFLALCLYLNLTAAVVCSVTTWVLATAAMIADARGTQTLGATSSYRPSWYIYPSWCFLLSSCSASMLCTACGPCQRGWTEHVFTRQTLISNIVRSKRSPSSSHAPPPCWCCGMTNASGGCGVS